MPGSCCRISWRSTKTEARRKSNCTSSLRRDPRTLCELENEAQGPRKGADCSGLETLDERKSRTGELTFALSADVSEAHRQFLVHPDDWHPLGCQVSPGGDVFVNTVGTFGIASASHYWSRVAAAIGRLVQYLSAYTSTSWHMLVADDYLLESGGPEYRIGLLFFFILCAVVGVPLSWHKTCGGGTLVWVGFELSYYSARDVSESWQEELNGLYVGRSPWPAHRPFTWDPSKRGSVESCSWLARLNMNDHF